MRVSATGVRQWRYWDIDPESRISYRSEDEYTEHFLELLAEAVRCRLRSIHPVGISLSGGNDSTLLAALAAGQLAAEGQKLHSFSYVFDRFPSCDERRWIGPVADRYRIDAHHVPADELLSFADVEHRPVPKEFFWTNCYAQLPEAIAAASARAGCRLLLDGMFGDALFCEPSMFAADLIRQFRLLELIGLLRSHRDSISWQHEILHNGIRQLAPRALRRAYRRWRPVELKAQFPFLTDVWQDRLLELQREGENRAETLPLSPGRKTRYQRVMQPLWAQGFAATRSNPYNRSGVERLSPYFDRRLVEFVLAIPTEQLSHAGRPRRLQKNAMRRLLPESVWQRRGKANFEPLLRYGLERTEAGLLREMSRESLAVDQGWIRSDWLEEALRRAGDPDRDLYAVTECILLELWLRAAEAARTAPSGNWSEAYRPDFRF
jgi:asparagine synthase (glutamine-hydrolysing)